ncbi:hypothetical protein BDR22DRAFT_854633 [Usnea florida]
MSISFTNSPPAMALFLGLSLQVSVAHFVKQCRKHLDKSQSVRGMVEYMIRVQQNHTFPFFQILCATPTILATDTISVPSQANMSFEPAAEEHLVKVTKRLDS